MTALKPNSVHDHAKGWQPIETAPKDGTAILVLNYVGGQTVVRWSNRERRSAICWRETWNMEPVPAPTHWHPLPAPPKRVTR